MSPKEFTAFRMAPELMDAMRRLKTRDGVPFSVQVDFALREWLRKKGIVVDHKADRKRATTRKRT
jgi:hypothetical protein